MVAATRLGFFGGSFDPPHVGHVAMARAVWEAERLDRVVLVPAARNPLKAELPVLPEAIRLAALRGLVAAEPWLGLWEGELQRPPPSYTIDTVAALAQEFPQAERWWILGADSVAGLPRWHRAAELVEEIGFLAVRRPGIDAVEAEASARRELPRLRLKWVSAPQVDVSATEIRRRLAAGEPWQDSVHPAVAAAMAQKQAGRFPL